MERSFDPVAFKSAIEMYPGNTPKVDADEWLSNPLNVMYDDDGSIGLCTYEYPGLFTVHWFFKVRGRTALNLARQMLGDLFENHGAEVVRGLTKVELKAARWAARQIGMKSYGILEYPGEDYELLCMTKNEFYLKGNQE